MSRPAAIAIAAAAMIAACGRPAVHEPAAARGRLAAAPPPPFLLYVSLASDETFRRVALAPLAAPASAAFVTPLSCERVYFSGTRGICLTAAASGSATSWSAAIFDERFAVLHRLPLAGNPSRVRISPDGRRAAATMFESGHAYDEHGFATRTTVIDTEAGAVIGDLEQFPTSRDGRAFREQDFNFWGLTFARDSDTFFATLQTGSVSYLVKGTIGGRAQAVLRPGVECPSLSPDNTRIAFKKRMGTQSRGWWQLAVLRLDTMTETLVSTESRSVDDQVEWLDDDRIAYHLTGGANAADVWSVRVDATAPPSLLVPAAYSPAVVRTGSAGAPSGSR
jgi:hypothetical protein